MSTKISTVPTEQGNQPKVKTLNMKEQNASLATDGIATGIDTKKMGDANREGNGTAGDPKSGAVEVDIETKETADVGQQPDTKSKEDHTEDDLKEMPVRQYLETTGKVLIIAGT